jgi:hypothetical protein
MAGGSWARAITPPFPNSLTAKHGLFPLSPRPTQCLAPAGRRAAGLFLSRPDDAPSVRAIAPFFAGTRRWVLVLSQCLPRPHARIEARIRAIAPLFRWMEAQDLPARVPRRLASELRSFSCGTRNLSPGDRPPISVDGDPGFACASVQTTRIGSPLIQLWNTEPIPGRSPPYFGGWRPGICLRECPDDSHRKPAHSAVEHGTYPRAIAPQCSGGCPPKYSGDCPLVFGRSPPA